MEMTIEDLLEITIKKGLTLEAATEFVYQKLKVETDIKSDFEIEPYTTDKGSQSKIRQKSLDIKIRIIGIQYYLRIKDTPAIKDIVKIRLHYAIERLVKDYYEWRRLLGVRSVNKNRRR